MPEGTAAKSTESNAAVIDVTKSVSVSLIIANRSYIGLLQGPRKGRAPQACLHC